LKTLKKKKRKAYLLSNLSLSRALFKMMKMMMMMIQKSATARKEKKKKKKKRGS
jgi:hypothetical protein